MGYYFSEAIGYYEGDRLSDADLAVDRRPSPSASLVGTSWTEVAEVPHSVTMRQARLALLHEGLLNSADQAIAAMSGVEGETARIEWGYAGTVERSSPLVSAIGQLLGLNDAALDGLFALAAGL